jgi:hypothetical protein
MVLECKHVWDYISEFLDDSLPLETKELVQKLLRYSRFDAQHSHPDRG